MRSDRMKLTVGRKLVGGLLIVILGAIVAGWSALNLAHQANQDSADIFSQEVVGLVDLARVVDDANEVRRRGLLHVLTADAAEKSALEEEIARLAADFAAHVEELERDWAGQEAKLTVLVRLHEQWDVYTQEREQVLELSRDGRFAAARAATTGPASRAFTDLTATFDELIELNEVQAERRLAAGEEDFSSGRNMVILVILAAALAGIVVAVLLARSIAGNVGRIATAAERLTAGDLSQRAEVTSGDELGVMATSFNDMAARLQELLEEERRSREELERAVADYSRFAAAVANGDLTARLSGNGNGTLAGLTSDLNTMVASLRELSEEVQSGAQSIGSAATEILATVSQHSSSATQQSAAISETSATVEEIRAAAEQVADKARDVGQRSQLSVEASSGASTAVEDIMTGMAGIRQRVQAIASQILDLSEQTQRIGEITGTVDDIADQSNLLALNATIEAAKAGEHGKGFAVVADEVRNLADQSKQAAAQVRSILGDIRKGTDGAVMTTEQGSRSVEEGASLAERAGALIEQLAEVIEEGAEASQQITASTNQQRIGMDQIAQAMMDINQATTQFVAGAEQSRSAASDLSRLAEKLQALTARYKV